MKKCFKCNIKKSLSKFYVHPKMKDGHLGKCKVCTRLDSKIREIKLRKNPKWTAAEKIRAREKYYRLGYKERHKSSFKENKKNQSRYKKKYPEKQSAKNSSQHLPRKKGYQLHHWSYNTQHWKDIIQLYILEHSKLHRYIIYDQKRKMYRRCDTMELLDTKSLHMKYFKEIRNKP